MKVCVLGAGVVGTTTAYFLQKNGHEVTVIDRQSGAGLETSFANGGQISASHAAPWAGPQVPILMLKWLGKEDAPLLYHLRADPALWRWSIQFFMNCRTSKSRENTVKSLKLALTAGRSFLKSDKTQASSMISKRLEFLIFTAIQRHTMRLLQTRPCSTSWGAQTRCLGKKRFLLWNPPLKKPA